MGRFIRDATPEQELALIEERRKFAFVDASRSPHLWLISARRHKRAADILYEVAHAAYERDIARLLARGFTGSGSRTLEGQELSDQFDLELLSDYFLLAGYSLECILKGCLVAMEPDLVRDDKKLDKRVATHNLVALCCDCKMPLSRVERQLLELIKRHVEWRKYPAPVAAKDMPNPFDPNPTPLDIPGSLYHERKTKMLVDGLYQRAYDLLERLRESNPQERGSTP